MAAVKPQVVIQKPPQYTRGTVSALGVLAELATIEPILQRHRQKTALKITLPLQEKIRDLLPTLGVKLPEEQQGVIVPQIATETARQFFEDAAKIQAEGEINTIVADSLTQTLTANPQIAPQLKDDETKIFEKVYTQTAPIVSQNQVVLEQTAVLSNLARIASLDARNQDVQILISQSIEDTVEAQAPLTPPEAQARIKADLGGYLTNYKQELFGQLQISQTIPTLAELQKAKVSAHQEATKAVRTPSTQIAAGKQVAVQIPPQTITANIARVFTLTPPTPVAPPKLPTGGGLVLSSPKRVEEAHLSLLAFDQEKLAKALQETSAEIDKYKSKKSLSYKERKTYLEAQKKHDRYVRAQAFPVKAAKKAQAYRTLFAQAYGGRPEIPTQQIWFAENHFIPNSMPRLFATNERLAAGAAFGSLGFQIAGVSPGTVFSKITSHLHAAKSLGMGITPAGLVTHNPATNLARKIRNAAAATLGALYMLALGLGKAAFAGAVVGSAIGAGAGAAFGVAILAPLGPIGWAAMPVVVPMTALTGGVVGGAAGMLIGLGVASGAATAISMGIGAGVGGTIGGIIGFHLGTAVGAAVMTGAIGLCIASALCAPFAPILIAVSPAIVTVFSAVGASAGALIGSAIGTLGGYVIGKYIVSPTVSAVKGLISGVEGGVGATGGFVGSALASAASFITGAASAIWGGITSAGGAALGFLSGAANFIVGGLSTLSIPASAVMIPVAGGLGAVAIGGTIVSLVTATSFFNSETDIPSQIKTPGENQFFTLSKTSNPQKLDNNDLPHDITFNITLTAKETKLTNIHVTDQLKVQTKSNDFLVTQDKNGKPISPPCADTTPTELEPNQSWNCQFVMVADKNPPERNFSDSFVANTVTVTTTPEGKTEITDSAVATVVIGNPPTICAIFEIQGPWSNDEKKSIDEVCKTLDRSPKIISLLQKAGTIYLIRVADGSLGSGVCGTVNGANTISISCNMANVVFAKYVIIHELGHVLGNYNGAAYNAFIGVYNQEGLMPTYPFADGGSSESFAEMIADFVISKSYNYPPRSWSNYPGGPWDFSPPQNGYTSFKNDRPAHYDFAKTEIFGGVEY